MFVLFFFFVLVGQQYKNIRSKFCFKDIYDKLEGDERMIIRSEVYFDGNGILVVYDFGKVQIGLNLGEDYVGRNFKDDIVDEEDNKDDRVFV